MTGDGDDFAAGGYGRPRLPPSCEGHGSGPSDPPVGHTATAAIQTAPSPAARIPVLMCINARYAQHAAVALVSLLENNRDSWFDVVVASTDELAEEAVKLRRSLARYENCALTVKHFARSAAIDLPVTAQNYSIDNYTRLWVAEFFPDRTEKILYLDSDIVVVADIRELWNVDVTEWVVGAVSIPGSDRCPALGIPERYGYFNSGVLLINLARWRKERMLDRLLDYITAHSDKIVDVDQDVLNACLYDRRLPLPYVWNVISPFFFDYHPLGIAAEELQRIRREAKIVHFNGAAKPWSYMCRHPRRTEYWKYLSKTAWRGYSAEDKTMINWLKKHVGARMPPEMRSYLKETIRGVRGRVRRENG